MSLVSCAAHRVRALVLTLLQLMKRLLCLFQKRRRKPSGDLVDMQDVVVESAYPSSHNSVPPALNSSNSIQSSIIHRPIT